MTPKKAMKIGEMFLHKQCDLERAIGATGYSDCDIWEATNMAFEALEHTEQYRWHVSSVPVDDRRVLCCTRTKSGLHNIVIGYYSGRWCCGMNSNVVAWMDLPALPEVEK